MNLYIQLLLVLTATCCQVYYNKDLKFDFSDSLAENITTNETNSMYFNLCGLLSWKCTQIVEPIIVPDTNTTTNKTTNTTNVDEEEVVNVEDVDEVDEDIDEVDEDIEVNSTTPTTPTPTKYMIEKSDDQQYSMISVDNSTQQCTYLSKQSGVISNQIRLKQNDKPFNGIYIARMDTPVELLLICGSDNQYQSISSTELQFTSNTACPQLIQNPLAQLYSDIYILFVCILMIFGLFLISFGFQMFRISSSILTGLNGFAFLTIIIGEATLDYDSGSAAKWIIVGAGIIVALLFAQLVSSKFVIGCFNTGFAFGTILSLMFNCLFLYQFEMRPIYLPLIISILSLGILFGLGACCYVNTIGILSTSFIGAFLVIRPIAWIAGGYPNEMMINKQQLYGFGIDMQWQFYTYISGIVVLSAISVFYQYKQLRKRMSMDELFSYQDMRYYELGNVNLQEKEQSEQNPQSNQEHDRNKQFLKSLDSGSQVQVQRKSNLTVSSKSDD